MEMVIDKVKLENYPAYKDSGVEWIGKIPKNWKSERLASILINVAERNRADLPLLSITREKGVILRDLDNEEENHNFIPDDLSNYKVLRKGQFGMNKMKAWQGSYGISEQDGIVSPAYFIFQLREDLDSRYFHLAIRSRLYVSFFGSASDGVRIGQWDLSRDRMKNIPFLIPPKEEQTAIAAFLDRKTALINQAIDIKQKQIELLKERRQILIHKAVTRGLNPNEKMKDSGVEWIGEIPEGWEVKRLKYFFNDKKSKFIDGDWIESKDINGEDYRYLTTGNIGEGFYKEQGEGYISSVTFKKLNCTEAIPGDLLICRLSLPLGRTCICPKLSQPIVLSVDVVIARMDSVYNRHFYNYLMNTTKYKEHTELVSRGSIMSRISRNILGNIFFQIPTPQEQIEIVNHLNNKTEKINNIISLKEQEIEKLKEYKATLINSAVTGKIKVC